MPKRHVISAHCQCVNSAEKQGRIDLLCTRICKETTKGNNSTNAVEVISAWHSLQKNINPVCKYELIPLDGKVWDNQHKNLL